LCLSALHIYEEKNASSQKAKRAFARPISESASQKKKAWYGQKEEQEEEARGSATKWWCSFGG
jgi:hypothetical protein